MDFGLSRGEIAFVAFVFALIYVAGLLPKIAARLAGGGVGADGAKGGDAEDRKDG